MEQLGKEPELDRMPADFEDFPYFVQLAITIYHILPDNWEGFSGTFLGKDYSLLPYLMDLYEVDDPAQVLRFILVINNIVVDIRSKEQKRQLNKAKKAKK